MPHLCHCEVAHSPIIKTVDQGITVAINVRCIFHDKLMLDDFKYEVFDMGGTYDHGFRTYTLTRSQASTLVATAKICLSPVPLWVCKIHEALEKI